MKMNFLVNRILARIACALPSVFACVGCMSVSKDQIVGTYVFSHNTYTEDTLRIFKGGDYEKRIYYRSDNRLIYVNKGVWELDGNRITFKGFLPNQEDKFSADSYDDVLMTASLPVGGFVFGKVRIEEGVSDKGGDTYYEKVE